MLAWLVPCVVVAVGDLAAERAVQHLLVDAGLAGGQDPEELEEPRGDH